MRVAFWLSLANLSFFRTPGHHIVCVCVERWKSFLRFFGDGEEVTISTLYWNELNLLKYYRGAYFVDTSVQSWGYCDWLGRMQAGNGSFRVGAGDSDVRYAVDE